MVDDGRTDDGRTPGHGHPISSPCEPNGSLKMHSGALVTVQNAQVAFYVFTRIRESLYTEI